MESNVNKMKDVEIVLKKNNIPYILNPEGDINVNDEYLDILLGLVYKIKGDFEIIHYDNNQNK